MELEVFTLPLQSFFGAQSKTGICHHFDIFLMDWLRSRVQTRETGKKD